MEEFTLGICFDVDNRNTSMKAISLPFQFFSLVAELRVDLFLVKCYIELNVYPPNFGGHGVTALP